MDTSTESMGYSHPIPDCWFCASDDDLQRFDEPEDSWVCRACLSEPGLRAQLSGYLS